MMKQGDQIKNLDVVPLAMKLKATGGESREMNLTISRAYGARYCTRTYCGQGGVQLADSLSDSKTCTISSRTFSSQITSQVDHMRSRLKVAAPL